MIENQTNLKISKKAQEIITIVRDYEGCSIQDFPRSRYHRYEVEFIDGTYYGSDSKQDIIEHIRGYNEEDYAQCFAKAKELEALEALKDQPEAMAMTFTEDEKEALHRADRQAFLLTQAENYGLDGLIGLVLTVWTPQQLATALAEDWYLNGSTCGKAFDIVQWDMLASFMTSARMKHVRMVNSYASRVSILKSVAREIVRRSLFADGSAQAVDQSAKLNEGGAK